MSKRPAFPHQKRDGDPYWGFDVREYFAAKAMQGLLASGMSYGGSTTNRKALANDAVAHADALIESLYGGSK